MKLYYFTYSYPYGMAEEWKANELRELVRHFDEIIVVPYFYAGNFDKPKTLPEGIKLEGPLFRENGSPSKNLTLFHIIFNRNVFLYLSREFFSKRVFLNKQKLISWINSSYDVIRLMEHPFVQKLIRSASRQTVLYFYWGKGSSEMLPFINTGSFNKTFVRMHRFDLFEYVNNNYIPYRGSLLNKITVAAPSSIAGKEHLQIRYPKAKSKIEVFRCGTVGNGRVSTPSSDNILRVVSCSGLSKVKRVELMIRSLQYVDFPIRWLHLGDGRLMSELKELSIQLNLNDKFIFVGLVPTEEVVDFYTNNTIDLFVNTSSSEGVPFSIMEAFSAGIPVMATDVGGTKEIVNGEVGVLLPHDITPLELAEHLKSFFRLPEGEKIRLRENAFRTYEQKWNAKLLAEELALYLKS